MIKLNNQFKVNENVQVDRNQNEDITFIKQNHFQNQEQQGGNESENKQRSENKNVNDEVFKEEDEDKKILMELIAQNNQKRDEYQAINESQCSNQDFQPRNKQHNTSIRIPTTSQSNQQLQSQQQEGVLNDITSLAQQKNISSEFNLLTNQNNNQQQNQVYQNNEDTINNILNKFQQQTNKYAQKKSLLSQGGLNQINSNTIIYGEQNISQQIGQNQQQNQLKTLLPRSQVQYQSGLSSSQSLTIQRDFHIYFHLPEKNSVSRSDSSDNQSYDQDEQSTVINQASSESVKVPIDDLHEEATVQDAILSAVCQINNYFSLQKMNIRLAYDENLYDLYLAKKDGEKKSLPALYPLEKMKKFNQSNIVLIYRDIKAIIRQKENKNQTEKEINNSFSSKGKGIAGDQKTNQLGYREIIREVNESMISIDQNNIHSGSNSFIKQKNTSSFLGNQSTPNTRKSIQTTINTNQTKTNKKESKDISVSPPSKCFSFFCCMSSSNKKISSKNNITNSSNRSKKTSTKVSK